MNVKILLPQKWWQKPKYKLLETVKLAGFKVPAGFVTDGATIPRFSVMLIGLLLLIPALELQSYLLLLLASLLLVITTLFTQVSRYFKATAIHDYHIQLGINRYECDIDFKKCLQELKIKSWRVNVMFTAVVIFGFFKKPKDYISRRHKKGCG